MVLYGNNKGEIITYHRKIKKLKKTPITNSAFTSFAKISDDRFIAGTRNGGIYIIKLSN